MNTPRRLLGALVVAITIALGCAAVALAGNASGFAYAPHGGGGPSVASTSGR